MTNWRRCELGEALTLQRGFDLPHRLRREGEIPVVSSSGISGTHDRAQVRAPGIVTGRYGTVGEVFYVTEDFWPLNTTLYVRDFRGNDPLYLSYLLRTVDFASHSGKSGVPGVNRNDIHKLQVVLPTRAEQCAIAGALSDVDRLLLALEVLIAKKRAIKQGAMQQLLAGKTRLPGFSGEWDTKRIGGLLDYERPDNYIVHRAEYTESGDVPVLTANKSFVLGYTDESFGVCQDLPVIIFDDFTTDRKYVTTPFKVKSSAIKLLRARDDRVSLRFVFERMQLISFPLGDHKRYYISEYQNIELLAPDFEEQLAIVAVLSAIDAEIATLERRRDKTRGIKQGMMQELLSGRVRLVKAPQAEATA